MGGPSILNLVDIDVFINLLDYPRQILCWGQAIVVYHRRDASHTTHHGSDQLERRLWCALVEAHSQTEKIKSDSNFLMWSYEVLWRTYTTVVHSIVGDGLALLNLNAKWLLQSARSWIHRCVYLIDVCIKSFHLALQWSMKVGRLSNFKESLGFHLVIESPGHFSESWRQQTFPCSRRHL